MERPSRHLVRRAIADAYVEYDRARTSDGTLSRMPTVIPRIVVSGASDLVAFIQRVFGATGEHHPERPAELHIGDSVILVSDMGVRMTMTAFLYVYVPDADAAYRVAWNSARARSRSRSTRPTAIVVA